MEDRKRISTDPLPDPDLEILPSREGVPTMAVRKNGRRFLLHSSFSPVREAEKAVSGLNPGSTIVVIGGFGLGYHVEAAAKKAGQALIHVLEKHPGLVAEALKARPDLSSLAGSPRVRIHSDPEELIGVLRTSPSTGLSYFFHRPSFDL